MARLRNAAGFFNIHRMMRRYGVEVCLEQVHALRSALC
jgi:hypothetical protein